MSLGTILLIILIVVLLGGTAPVWPHSHGWGLYPFGGVLGIVILIVIVLLITRRL
jgi:hypothetical protein